MLHWRLILGFLLAALLVGLAWIDFSFGRPGIVLAPLAWIGCVLSAGELVRIFEQDPGTPAPSRYVVVTGSLITVLASCVPMLWANQVDGTIIGRVGCLSIGLAGASLAAFTIEMLRYREPGSATSRLALAILGIAYAGGLMGFVVQLRLLQGEPWDNEGRWGMIALFSLVATVKTNDIGAYFVGRFLGRTKMAPVLSPGKTWEGAIGGFVVSALATAATLGPIAHACGCHTDQTFERWLAGCAAFTLLVGAAGVAGDLAVSLLKRDARLKNSSSWMPGFGGVLDLLDSVVFAAPVAYLLWLFRCVGP